MTFAWAKSLARVVVASRGEEPWGCGTIHAIRQNGRSGAAFDATALIYELLDAHEDTARLVREAADNARWDAHLDYLRSLQRTGREVLAALASTDATR
jgi:hypothetical protein